MGGAEKITFSGHFESDFSADAGWVRTDFDDTLPMSSYLLALVVSDFEFVEGNTSRGTRVGYQDEEILTKISYPFPRSVPHLVPQGRVESGEY